MVSFRVRGIYSTALTRLLLDKGFRIVEPSVTIKERLNLLESSQERPFHDLDIYDWSDRQGVNAVGDKTCVNAFAELLLSTFDDVIIRPRLFTHEEYGSPNYSTDFTAAPITIPPERVHSSSGSGHRLNVEFPGSSKTKLDSLRALVTPTLEGHHYYKACEGKISSLLEMVEKMLEDNCPRKEVEALFRETVEREFPHQGSAIVIKHVKIDGKVFNLGPAEITEFNKKNRHLRLRRTFFTKGLYDGLRTRKNPGDYAVTDMTLGEWSFRTRYFSKSGLCKGTYININTPLEMYPTEVRYVDLEVDVCLWPDGKIRTFDREKLEKMIIQGRVSRKLGRIVDEKTEEIMNSLSPEAEKDSL